MKRYAIPDMMDYISTSVGESVLEQIKYIRAERPDVMRQLIQDHTPEHLMYKLKSQYILSSVLADTAKQVRMDQAVLLAFLGNMEALPESLTYLEPLFQEIDMHLITDSADIYDTIAGKYGGIQGGLRMHLWKEESETLSDMVRSYEYVCVVHDTPHPLRGVQGRIAQSESYVIWDNLLKSPAYLRNIIAAFTDDPYLGVLVPPRMTGYRFSGKDGDPFRAPPPRLEGVSSFRWFIESRNTCCWCKTEIFAAFLSAAEAYPDIARRLGYITGTVMNDRYGGIHAMNLDEILRQLIKSRWTPIHETFPDCLKADNSMWLMDLWAFFVKHPSVMIYGTGGGAESVRPYFELAGKPIEGYIVSDGYRMEEQYEGVRVYELSEVDKRDGLGIVVAMTAENTQQVLPALQSRGFDIFLNANCDGQQELPDSGSGSQD